MVISQEIKLMIQEIELFLHSTDEKNHSHEYTIKPKK